MFVDKCIEKYCLQDADQFIPGSMCRITAEMLILK